MKKVFAGFGIAIIVIALILGVAASSFSSHSSVAYHSGNGTSHYSYSHHSSNGQSSQLLNNQNNDDRDKIIITGTVVNPSSPPPAYIDGYICTLKIDKIVSFTSDYGSAPNCRVGDEVPVYYGTYGEYTSCGTSDYVKIGDKVEVYGVHSVICGSPVWHTTISICGKSSYYLKKIGSPTPTPTPTVWNVKFEGIISQIFNKESSNWYDAKIKVTKVTDDPSHTIDVNEIVNVYRANEDAYEDAVSVGDLVEVCAEYNSEYYKTNGYALRDWIHHIKKIEEKMPDLIIQDITWSPSNPKEGDTITFTVTVKNQGTGDAGAFYVYYYTGGSYVDYDYVSSLSADYYIGGSYVDYDYVPSLSAGSTSTQSFTWTVEVHVHVPMSARKTVSAAERKVPMVFPIVEAWIVRACADATDLVGESNEDNNCREETVEINEEKKPDLVIEDIFWEPKNPETGDPVNFTITIKNIGTKDGNKPIYVDFKFCGNYFPRKKIDGLKAGESANVIYTGIGAGTCEAIATVDPYNAIPESDETNNIMIKTLVTKEVLKEYREYLSKSSNFYKNYSKKILVPSYWHGEAKQLSTEVTNEILINIDTSLATHIVTIIAPATSTVLAPFSILTFPFNAANLIYSLITSDMMAQDCDGVGDALYKSDFFTLRDKMSLLEFNADLLDSELKKGSPNLEMTLQIRRQEILDAYEQLCSFDQEFASNVDNTGHLSDKASKYNLAHLYIAGLATKLREDYAVTTAVLNAYTDTDSDAEIPDFEKYELKSHCFECAATFCCFGYLKDKKEVDEYAITIDQRALEKKVDVNRPSGYYGFEDYLKTSYTLYDAGGKKIGEENSNTGLHCNVKVHGTYYLDVQNDAGAGGYVVIIDSLNLVKGGVQIVPPFQ